MKILFVGAECAPFLKTGGLGDVLGALPGEIKQLGAEVRVMLPLYTSIPDRYRTEMKTIAEIRVQVGWRYAYCGIKELEQEGVIYYFLDNEQYFNRGSAYGQDDDGERFAFLCRAALESLYAIGYWPDIIHGHDWHTGMIPALLRHHYSWRQEYAHIKTVFTIHNLQYQGNYSPQVLGDLFGLPPHYLSYDHVEFRGSVSFMKAGIQLSDRVTTVSPSYAREITTTEYGCGMEGVLRSRGESLVGIVNGIDDALYDPASDSQLQARYSAVSPEAKLVCKTALQWELGLNEDADVPIIGMVGRLMDQKGLPLVLERLDELMHTENVQLALLGTGDPYLEYLFREAEHRHTGAMVSYIGFDDGLARRIYAGSDLFLMPSQFEPCGISQLLALRYGSLPIVRETGGLRDTVHSYQDSTGEGNGFSFGPYNSGDMLYTVRRALSVWRNTEVRDKLMRRALQGDYSWKHSAQQYLDLYQEVI
ncbi:glycogen synthase GlgA [Paenibacillus glycanilyticus]|uniref:Glycogen synthase n=1 Tax=Paenibacillus glycanilyticus TaxID=126569 RepID=A0ABQ6G5R6_9BACL|nr:glycogen synthase GlgA [Paenibacillus glycanilyticus]GLX66316.1 glycogen synthase [Paenibacillus glycanilyticus]